MATPEQITALRLMVGEPTDEAPWTDENLEALIDAADSNLNLAAFNVWTAKAATYAGMVDTTESGSSRKLSQLQEQALKMAGYYQDASGIIEVVELQGYAYTTQIVRA